METFILQVAKVVVGSLGSVMGSFGVSLMSGEGRRGGRKRGRVG